MKLIRLLSILMWSVSVPALAQTLEAKISIRADTPGATIDPNIYGQFVEHLGRGVYEGIWVGESSTIPNVRGIRSDVVAALRKIRVPLVRWPGGCFAELYHWRDGVGPRDQRPKGINAAWNDEPETNAFGINEFMDLVEQIGAKPFLAINVTSGTPGEAQAWLQYLTGPEESAAGKLRASHGRKLPYQIPFIGIGNETWGCGGNMTAEYYSDIYRQYLAVLRPYGTLVVADANSDDYAWTEVVLQKALFRHANPTPLAYINRNPQIAMMSVHYYTLAGNDWTNKGAPVSFAEKDWALALERAYKMDEIITKHSAIIDKYDPERRIGLSIDEWGTWWTAPKDTPSNLYQQNTLRDAVIAGLTLNIFQNHAERVRMANIAQMVNVLQSMILTRGERMIVTPTYHVFDLYQVHQSGSLLPVQVAGPSYSLENITLPMISASASRDTKGAIHLSIVNLDPKRPARIVTQVQGTQARRAIGQVLTADSMDARSDFDHPARVMPVALKGIRVNDHSIHLTLPAKSVAVVELQP